MKDISEQLKDIRMKTGLSLQKVARKADTSPATLFRYENGWKRFEIYTLNKVASALGYRVRVEFDKLPEHGKSTDPKTVVKQLKRLFWDSPLKVEYFSRYPAWVVERVLDYGTLQDVESLVRLFGRDEFLRIISGIRFKSAKTGTFWQSILKKENIKCTRKSCHKEAVNSWPA